MNNKQRRRVKKIVFLTGLALAILLVQGLALFLLGQPAICECGYVKLWEGVVRSPGNSQHLSDWYSFSHIIHGLVFYAALWALFPRMPVRYRFLLALGIEAGWEIFENTPWVINLYRQQALAQGYVGDSILNSLSDTLFASLGLGIARRVPVWASIALIIAFEVWVVFSIHDNLLLNVLNFVSPLEFIRQWQAGM